MKIEVERRTGNDPKDLMVIQGGYWEGFSSWKEYLGLYRREFRPYFSAIHRKVAGEEPTSGEMNNEVWWEFSDGTALAFTWRAWGDLMSVIHGGRYLDYYMELDIVK